MSSYLQMLVIAQKVEIFSVNPQLRSSVLLGACLISEEDFCQLFLIQEVDHLGLDIMDRKLLLTMIEKFDGGPVGVDNLAAAISEERETIEDVLEPYLIQQGYLKRTPKGRMVTAAVYHHFGIPPLENKSNDDFWERKV